ncbi:integrase [Escherichia coli]|nr:integrase [Escherichia coli]EKP2688996.1 integrase [Escherichia coli]
MHRIDTKTAQKDKFGAGKNGFTRGNPQTGTPATDLDDDYFDMLQEELCSVVEASGASLEKGRHDQLLTALRALLLSRKNPFGDIKSDGTVPTALENLRLGAGAPAIGIPFFWPSSAMPNTVMPEWADMVFLKFNGATFSATTYPKLALVFPGLTLTEARGEFLRVWDDGRGIDSGRQLLSAQRDAIRNLTGQFFAGTSGNSQYVLSGANGVFSQGGMTFGPNLSGASGTGDQRSAGVDFNASRQVPTASENRPRNIAFNFLVRAK